MVTPANLRLDNLLASLSLNLAEEGQRALERASGLTGSATTALLALEEFLDGAHVGRLAAVLGLTHSGAVRVVTQLERDGLAERHEGADRRRVEVRLTAKGRKRSRQARAARDEVLSSASSGLTVDEGRALEALLDPLVATLDNLPEHFDPVYAPRDVLDLLTAWLGLEHDEARSGEERREIVRMAPELMRRRGTKDGLELALGIAFPGVPFRVQDGGSVTWSVDLTEPEPSEPPAFVVYCDVPLSAPRLAAVARLIEQAKPAHVSYRLRVKAPNPHEGGDA